MIDFIKNFKAALDRLGTSYTESGSSLKIQDCPACGSSNYKVHMRIDDEECNQREGMLFGRCYAGKCQENFSSIKYLTMSGIERAAAMRLHGKDPYDFSWADNNIDNVEVAAEIRKPKLKEIVDISKFVQYASWPKHPASVYAVSRGAVPEMARIIQIDPIINAVVFVVYDSEGDPIGYQKRFLKPLDPKFKTQTSSGFSKSSNILVFPKAGAKLVVCEGPFTALAAYRYGYTGICTFGAGVSSIQLDQILEIAKKSGTDIGLCFDLDDAGRKGFEIIRSYLHSKGRSIFRVKINGSGLAHGFDLNDAWKSGLTVTEEVPEWAGPAIPDLGDFL
jgi:hypothetical protein